MVEKVATYVYTLELAYVTLVISMAPGATYCRVLHTTLFRVLLLALALLLEGTCTYLRKCNS